MSPFSEIMEDMLYQNEEVDEERRKWSQETGDLTQ